MRRKRKIVGPLIFTADFMFMFKLTLKANLLSIGNSFLSPELFYPLASPLSNTIRIFNTSYIVPFSQPLLIRLGLQNITIQY